MNDRWQIERSDSNPGYSKILHFQAPKKSLQLQWKSKKFPAHLIFKSSPSSAYDIALVQGVPNETRNMKPITFAKSPPMIGTNSTERFSNNFYFIF